MPTNYLRVSATWPLAELVVHASGLSLRLRHFAKWAGGIPLEVAPGELARVYPTRSMWTRGLGFTDRQGREWYFWTGQVQRVLDVLRERGYPVTYVSQRADKIWKGTP